MPLTLTVNISNLMHTPNIINMIYHFIFKFLFSNLTDFMFFLCCVDDSCSEFKFIQEIVEEISNSKLNCTPLSVARYPIGINYRVKTILSDIESNDAHMIGIYGPGGIGKTTIAKAIFNKIYNHFDGFCYLENFREKSGTNDGVIELQE